MAILTFLTKIRIQAPIFNECRFEEFFGKIFGEGLNFQERDFIFFSIKSILQMVCESRKYPTS